MTRRPYPDAPPRPVWLQTAEHARADANCQRCHDDRTFYAFISPDPSGRAQVRVERMARDWLTAHPCVATYLTTRKKAA